MTANKRVKSGVKAFKIAALVVVVYRSPSMKKALFKAIPINT